MVDNVTVDVNGQRLGTRDSNAGQQHVVPFKTQATMNADHAYIEGHDRSLIDDEQTPISRDYERLDQNVPI